MNETERMNDEEFEAAKKRRLFIELLEDMKHATPHELRMAIKIIDSTAIHPKDYELLDELKHELSTRIEIK